MPEKTAAKSPPTEALLRYRPNWMEYAIKQQIDGMDVVPFPEWSLQQYMIEMQKQPQGMFSSLGSK